MIENQKLMERFDAFLENYKSKYSSLLYQDKKYCEIDFTELMEYDYEAATELLDNTEQTLDLFKNVILKKKENTDNQDNQLSELSGLPELSQLSQLSDIPIIYQNTLQLKILYYISRSPVVTFNDLLLFFGIDKKGQIHRALYANESNRSPGLCINGLVASTVACEQTTKRLTTTLEGLNLLSRLKIQYESTKQNNNTIQILVENLPKSHTLPIGNIRVKHIGKLFSFEGIIRQMSEVRPQVTFVKFECPACGNIINVIQIEKRFKEPVKCSCGRKGKFKIHSKRMVDAQGLILEDLGANSDLGQVKRFKVYLNGILCDSDHNFIVGNRVMITGEIREVPTFLQKGSQSTQLDLIIHAYSINNLDDKSIKLGDKEKLDIMDFKNKSKNILSDLVKLFAPSIEGNEHIKKALILQSVSRDEFLSRGRVHVFVFGDYGTGKTRLCEFGFKSARKSVKVDATKSSEVGLTASVCKDEFLGGYALEAGAIVLAGDGLCFIDEIDKRKDEESSALGEPMESGTVTVTKANIHQTMVANSKILLCGNPRYIDDHEGVDSKSLKVSNHILDRCDLILKSEDIPSHSLGQKIFDNLRTSIKENDYVFLRNYLYYAEKFQISKSPINSEVETKIVDFFTKIKDSGIKISARFLESIIRLSIASAKLQLKPSVDIEDANIAIELVQRSLKDRNYKVII